MGRGADDDPVIHCRCTRCGHRRQCSDLDLRYGMLCPRCQQGKLRPVKRVSGPKLTLDAEGALGGAVLALVLSGGLIAAAVFTGCGARNLRLGASLIGFFIACVVLVLVTATYAAVTYCKNSRQDARDNREAAENERAARRRRP